MSRTYGEMSNTEKAQYNAWKAKLDNNLSTDQEKNEARARVDALLWKGQTGPVMEQVTKLNDRLTSIEEQGKSVTDEDRKALLELRQLSKCIDAKKLAAIEKIGVDAMKKAEYAIQDYTQKHDDNQVGWSKHEAELVKVNKAALSVTQRIDDLEKRYNEKFREVEAQVTLIRRDLNSLITDAIDEARTAIHAEAVAAAVEAVGNLLGESDSSDEDTVDC